MKKRVAAAILWAAVGWVGGELVTGIFGAPSFIALIPAVLMPAFVLWDPTGMLWGRSFTGKLIVRPINELAAELDARNAPPPSAEAERISR
jgi:hypothetical protein